MIGGGNSLNTQHSTCFHLQRRGILAQTDYAYDAHGRQSQVIDARNGATTYTYNAADLRAQGLLRTGEDMAFEGGRGFTPLLRWALNTLSFTARGSRCPQSFPVYARVVIDKPTVVRQS